MSKWLLIGTGTLTWSLTMVKSGVLYPFGIGFWGANGHDALWHLSLIDVLSRGSLQLPMFAGERITNYHIGFDVLLALLSRVSGVQPSVWYFQLLPPLLAFFVGLLTYNFIQQKISSHAAFWSTFFVYFGTGLGFLVGKGESAFWSQQAISTLINPPFALSLTLILALLLVLRSFRWKIAILLLVLLPQIKIYAGIIVFIALGLRSLKDRRLLPPIAFAAALTAPIYFLLNPHSGGLIIFQPLWFLDTLYAPDRLDIPRLFSALNTYKSGLIIFKLIPTYLVTFVIFIAGNLGLRLAGLFPARSRTQLPERSLLLLGSCIGVILSLLFIQAGTNWNTIQFFYYSLFFLSLLAGPVVAGVIESIRPKSTVLSIVLVLVLLAFSVPANLQSLQNYLPARPPAMISTSELPALAALKNLPQGVVIVQPFDRQQALAAETNPPRPLALYESTAYVSAYTGQSIYLEDEVNLSITGFDWPSRKHQLVEFFTSTNPSAQQLFISQNHIRYLYLTPYLPEPHSLPPNTLLYDSQGFKIYEFIAPIPRT